MFYQWELDICPAFGWQGGPGANTRIDSLKNQHERRVPRGDLMRHTFNLPFNSIDDETYYQYVKSAHAVMYGMLHSFLVKDHLDYTADQASLGVAPSGTTAVQLQIPYEIVLPGGMVVGTRERPITKPVANGLVMYQANGSGVLTPKTGTVDELTGLWTPSTSWTAGRAIAWSGEFRVPVRFNNDIMPASIVAKSRTRRFIEGSIELIEVFGE